MKKTIATAFASLAVAASASVATVSNVAMTQSSEKNRVVTITYDIDADAVVTVDIQTNATGGAWASIGAEHVVSVWGDVNRKIESGTGKEIKWAAGVDWEQHSVAGARAVVTAWALDATPDYMAVSLETPSNVWYYASAGNVPGGVTNDMYKTSWLLLRKIPAKGVTWRMGIGPTDKSNYSTYSAVNRCAAHLVQLSDDYYIGVYPVTQRQFALMKAQYSRLVYPGDGPSGDNIGDKKPKPQCDYGYIRWDSWPGNRSVTQSFADLYGFRNFTGIEFDLPTEAQWEFACRGGNGGPLYTGKTWTEANVNEIAFSTSNSGDTAHLQDVGQKLPNGYGLYDMCGNIWEICLDWYCDYYHEGDSDHEHASFDYETVTVDPVGPAAKWDHNPQNTFRVPRVARGGCYVDTWQWSTSHARTTSSSKSGWFPQYMGYRVVAPMGGTW